MNLIAVRAILCWAGGKLSMKISHSCGFQDIAGLNPSGAAVPIALISQLTPYGRGLDDDNRFIDY
jgi:hypothetical protein